jgi:hypothetical protein
MGYGAHHIILYILYMVLFQDKLIIFHVALAFVADHMGEVADHARCPYL